MSEVRKWIDFYKFVLTTNDSILIKFLWDYTESDFSINKSKFLVSLAPKWKTFFNKNFDSN